MVNHLIRKHRSSTPKTKADAHTLKVDLMENAKKIRQLKEEMRTTQIILQAKNEGKKKKD